MLRHFMVFLVLQIGLFVVEMLPPVQLAVVIPWTALLAEISGSLMQWFDSRVIVQGITIRDAASGFAVAIKGGCNGVEATILLVAAVLAFPAPWRYKLAGLLVGALSIQVLNVVRIISLFYLGQWDEAVFDWAHLYVWQALIMLDAVIVFLLWLRALPPQTPAPAHVA